ncbi:MAG TPA: hypothetical protein PKH23_04645 [Bacillota bacterium]|nr:hypothetical protein [Bacillota bacterium]
MDKRKGSWRKLALTLVIVLICAGYLLSEAKNVYAKEYDRVIIDACCDGGSYGIGSDVKGILSLLLVYFPPKSNPDFEPVQSTEVRMFVSDQSGYYSEIEEGTLKKNKKYKLNVEVRLNSGFTFAAPGKLTIETIDFKAFKLVEKKYHSDNHITCIFAADFTDPPKPTTTTTKPTTTTTKPTTTTTKKTTTKTTTTAAEPVSTTLLTMPVETTTEAEETTAAIVTDPVTTFEETTTAPSEEITVVPFTTSEPDLISSESTAAEAGDPGTARTVSLLKIAAIMIVPILAGGLIGWIVFAVRHKKNRRM